MIPFRDEKSWKNWWQQLIVFFLGAGWGLSVFVPQVHANLQYGQAYPDIGTFQTQTGNWSLWIGWDANFSETYVPEGESYAWVVYFAPEAVYLALQSSKSVYSGVNVNAGFKYFYGALNLVGRDRLPASLPDAEVKSVGLSKNLFNASAPVMGVGAFGAPNLSFSLSSGITFFRESNTDVLKRGIQLDSGVSVSYDLISLPLPFSVSLGTECEAGDPPELCMFTGFYPILIWEFEQPASQNPLETILSALSGIGGSFPQSAEQATKIMLGNAIQIMQSNTDFIAFLETTQNNARYDILIDETQEWLESGDTSNLPGNVGLPDPEQAHQEMKPLFSITQMAFELGYQRGCQANPACTTQYADCVVEQYCSPGKTCVVEITAEAIADLFPGKTAADFEGAWLLIDNSVEQYLVSEQETTEWVQIENGMASYSFMQNTETPIVLGVKIDPAWAPVDTWVELCRRLIRFTGLESTNDPVIILTEVSPETVIYAGNTVSVYGTSGADRITLESGAKAELINLPGQNLIEIQSGAGLFTVYRSGTVVTFQGSDGTLLKIPATLTFQDIDFTDKSLQLSIQGGQVMLSSQVIESAQSPVTGE